MRWIHERLESAALSSSPRGPLFSATALFGLVVVLACSAKLSARPEPPERFEPNPGHGTGEPSGYGTDPCPLSVPGVEMARVPIEGGMAIVFTSPAAPRVELMWRVETFAEQYAAVAPANAAAEPAVPFATDTTVRLVPAGARLEITARDPLFVDVLREQVVARVQWMAETRECGAS